MGTIIKQAVSVVAAAVLVLGTAAAAPVADPVAVVVKVAGSVAVERAAGGSAPAAVGTRLEPGDRLVPAAGGSAILLYRTGRKVTATQAVEIEAVRSAEQAGLFERSVGTLARVATTDAAAHPNRQGMIRPITGAAVPIAPRNQIAVLDERPTFSWFSLPRARGYMIQLRRVDGPCAPGAAAPSAECRPVRYTIGKDTAWTMPERAEPLVRGAAYAWTVASTSGGRPAPEQRFRVAGAGEVERVEAGIAELAAAGLDPEGDGLFLAALLYREAGLMYHARSALDRLVEQGLGTGADFHRLSGEVYDALGQLDAAAREFDAASAR